MPDLKTLKHHANLMDRMADTVGVDLQDAVIQGAARFDDIADAVLHCTECSNPAHCAAWLEKTPAAEEPPGYCRNAELFARLKAEAGS